VQSVPVSNEMLGIGTGTPFQTFTVANTPVIAGSLSVEVNTKDGWQQWQGVDDIYAAQPTDNAYMADLSTGAITLGSGLAGARVPLGAQIRASYQYGGGLQGQVAIGGITKSSTLPGGFSVTNPVATWGAGDGESAADGEAAITRWLRHRDRLVTDDDFHDLTSRTPGVDLGRVEVLPLFNPNAPAPAQTGWPGAVTILVIPRSDPLRPAAPQPDLQVLDAVCAWLTPRRLITTELYVNGPCYQPIWVSVGIEALPGQVPSLVQQAVTTAVQTFLSPLYGGLDGTGWPLGVNVRSQDIEAVATRVAGVRYVDSVLIAAANTAGAVSSPVDPVVLTGLQLPAATVFVNTGSAVDPATLIGGSQPVPSTQFPVPVVPPTC
jgi:predicted phage baseplate assembly protein